MKLEATETKRYLGKRTCRIESPILCFLYKYWTKPTSIMKNWDT